MRYRWKVNTPQVTVAHGERFDRLESRVVGRLGVLARALLSPCAAYPFPRFRPYNNTEGDHLKIREG